MKTKKKLAFAIGSTILLALSTTSNAALVTVTDTSAWGTNLSTYGVTLDPTIETFSPTPVTSQIVNNVLTTTPNGLFNVFYTTRGGIDETKNKFDSQQLKLQFDTTNEKPGTPDDATGVLEFRFNNPVSAFAADFFEVGSDHDLVLSVGGEKYHLRSLFNNHADGFFGVIATAGETFDKLSFSATSSENFIVDNVRIGNVSSVPLPAAVWLMGTALLALAGIGRRKTQ